MTHPAVPPGGLSSRHMNFYIPSNQGTHDHALQKHGEDSWRYRTVKFVHSPKVQVTLMALLLCDVIILFVELFFSAQYPHCTIIERDAVSCCPVTATAAAFSDSTGGVHRFRFLSSSTAEHGFVCPADLVVSPEFPSTCNPHKWASVDTTENVLFAITVFILSVFMLELNATMLALTPCIFFRQFFFLLDYVIITVSLVLELSFHIVGDDAVYEYIVGALVVARVWRFVRIGHGIMEITNEMAHRSYSDLLAYAQDLQDRLDQHNIPYPPMDARMRQHQEENNSILEEVERQRLAKLKEEYNQEADAESRP